MELPNKRLLRADEVAAFLGVHVETVRKYRRKGLLRGHVLPGGDVRFVSDEIRHLVAENCPKLPKAGESASTSCKRLAAKRPPFHPSKNFVDWVAQYGPTRLARDLGVSRSNVYAWIGPSGKRHIPRIERAYRIVELSKVEPLRGTTELTIADILGSLTHGKEEAR